MLDSVLRGAQSMLAFMVATFADLFIRVVLCYTLNPVLHTEGIWWSWPIGWTAATLISVGLYLSNRWYKSERAKSIFSALNKKAEYDEINTAAVRTDTDGEAAN